MQQGAVRSRRCVIAQRERKKKKKKQQRVGVCVTDSAGAEHGASASCGIHNTEGGVSRTKAATVQTPSENSKHGGEMRSNSWCTLFTCGVA